MLKKFLTTKNLVAITLVAAAACGFDVDESEHPTKHDHTMMTAAHMHQAAGRQVVWNPAPGDPTAIARMTTTPLAKSGGSFDPGSTKRTLVLYDTSGAWGGLGEFYAIGAANLSSHFGSWTAKAAVTYTCGELATYDATLYIGSSYDEPLPTCLLDDVLASTKPVVWSFFNIWQLVNRAGYTPFTTNYGWFWTALDMSMFPTVEYKGRSLNRHPANVAGLLGTIILDPNKAHVIANARRADGTTLPWAVRAGNLTYVAEIPFTYMSEEDRYLVFSDLLFDALAPSTPERHRAVVRIEDISPVDDPAALRAIADYLYSQGVPFGMSLIAEYRDPLGWYNGGAPETVRLDQSPEVVSALKYMISRGGTPVMHGWTHQLNKLLNPYTAVSGDDFEFYRVTENLDHSLTFHGPPGNDSVSASLSRISNARNNYRRASMASPTIWEFPHYAGSPNAYKAVASTFTTRWDRTLYFSGQLSGAPPTYQTVFGQLFPYMVRDVHGTRVIPENLGNIEPEPFYIFPVRFPADIVNAAEKNLVVRDGTVGFYFHPFFDLQYLKDTVQGMKAIGYTFVSPASL